MCQTGEASCATGERQRGARCDRPMKVAVDTHIDVPEVSRVVIIRARPCVTHGRVGKAAFDGISRPRVGRELGHFADRHAFLRSGRSSRDAKCGTAPDQHHARQRLSRCHGEASHQTECAAQASWALLSV